MGWFGSMSEKVGKTCLLLLKIGPFLKCIGMPCYVQAAMISLRGWKVAEVGFSCALAAGQRKFDRQMERVWGEDGRGGANMDREHGRNGPGGVPPPHGGNQMHPMAASAGLQMPAGSGHMGGPVGVPMGGPPGQWAVPPQFVPGQPFMPMVPGAHPFQGLKRFHPNLLIGQHASNLPR